MNRILYTLLLFCGFSQIVQSQQILNDTVQLSEVVITAGKRAQKIIDLPASVTSISINRIESEKAKTLRNLSCIVPNFYMPEYGSKLTSPVYIRGVGSRINNPSVGLYVDRVPYFEKSAFAFDFADIERIEVLRGPQGTLYGRNTMGGIINVITRAPRNYRELCITTDFGDYGYMKYHASYNEPITDKLSVMISGGYTERDGFFTNKFYNENVGSDFTKNGSLKVRYNPIKPLVLTYKIGAERSYEKGYPYGILDSTNHVKEINYNRKSRYSRDIVDNSLTASLYLDKFVLTSVSAVQYLKDKQEIDQDFMPKDYYLVKQGVKQNQYSQEIVLSTNESKQIEATVGVFGFIQNADRDIDLLYGTDSKELKSPQIVPGNGYIKYNNEDNSGLAAFGQATLKKFLGIFDVTFGLRYDYEWNSLKYTYYTKQAENLTLKKDTLFKASFKQLLPKVALQLNIINGTSAYFVTSKGYRGGGFNTAFVRPEDETYSAEDSWNYEVGVKSTIIPGVLSANAALFYIDWNNQQVSQRVLVGGNMYKNAGETYSKGIEAEFLFNPVKNLQIGGNIGYTEAKYVDFKPNLSDTINYKNKYLPFVPRYTYSAFIGYSLPVKSTFIKSMYVNISAQGIGKQYWNDTNAQSADAYSVVNGVVGIQSHMFGLSIWAKNLLNQEYYPYRFYIDQFKNWYAQKGTPLTVGISLSVTISGENKKQIISN